MSQVTMPVTKAIITAAGFGTRFLPATKNIPKELLPIIDKPGIHYLVDELVESGITDIIIVTRFGNSALEDYFDTSPSVEQQLESAGKLEELERLKNIYKLANIVYVRQRRDYPYGNGTPLLSAGPLIDDNEPFLYLFGDDLVQSEVPASKQLVDFYQKNKGVILGVQEVSRKEVSRYGICKLKSGSTPALPAGRRRVESVIEKPSLSEVEPPYLAQFGRFVLNKEIYNIILRKYEQGKLGKGGELWLTDAILEYAKNSPVYAVQVEGEWMTTGDPLRFLQTTIKFALQREDIAPDLIAFLKNLTF
ncbi:MAG: sugar phosphate nucleotidyltransferase [bacterium]